MLHKWTRNVSRTESSTALAEGRAWKKQWSDKGRKTKNDMQERRNRYCVPLVAIGADEKKSNGTDEGPEITTDRAPRRVKRCSVKELKTWNEKVRFAGRGKASSGKCGLSV
jgi:hypothetical protein